VLLFSITPFVLLLASNTVLVIKMREFVSGDHVLTTSQARQAGRKKTANSITLTAVVVSAAFIVFTLPLGVKNVLSFSIVYQTSHTTPREQAVQMLLTLLFYSVAFFNYSLNFYLYCLTGARFSDTFLSLWLCRRSDSAETTKPTAQDPLSTTTTNAKRI
jgi:hypothetical protein